MLKKTSFRRDCIPVFHTTNRQVQTTVPRTISFLVFCTIALSSVNEVASQGVADCVVNGDGLDCFRCSVNITVEVDVDDDDCSERVGRGQSLANLLCSSLQDVLESIAANITVHGVRAFDCIAIVLRPGEHVISSAVEISQNVVWRVEEGEEEEGVGGRGRRQASRPTPSRPMSTTSAPTLATQTESRTQDTEAINSVRVTFALNSTFDPLYAVSFTGSRLVGMAGIMFHSSPGILGFEAVSVVAIENCSFSHFEQGVLDIYNCPTVAISNSQFSHNIPAAIFKSVLFRGHSPGLSIGYNYRMKPTALSPVAMVTNCTFWNNSASNRAGFEEVRFPGSGGGLALMINGLTAVSVRIENCVFRDNYAERFGGGAFIFVNGQSKHTVTINRCVFEDNISPGSGGGLEIVFLEPGTSENTSQVLVSDSQFLRNRAQHGGGAYFFPLGSLRSVGEFENFVRFERCRFRDNTASESGAAFGTALLFPLQYRQTFRSVEFVDCNFARNANEAPGAGILTTAYFPLSFHGNNNFRRNSGATLTVIGARVSVYGLLNFSRNGNTAFDSGALYVTSLGQVELFPGARMNFSNNNGNQGAALIARPLRLPAVLSRIIFNPMCTLLFNGTTTPPTQWDQYNVSLGFHGNQALVASAVFLNNLLLCSWSGLSPPFFEPHLAFRWSFVNLDDNVNMAHAPNGTNPRWAVQTPVASIQLTINKSVNAYPGEDIDLRVSAFDELNAPTSAVVRLRDESTTTFGMSSSMPDMPPMRMEVQSLSDATEYLRFVPSSATLDRIQLGSINTSFNILLNTESRVEREEVVVETLISPRISREVFDLTPLRCPAGYTLPPADSDTQQYGSCRCDQQHPQVVDCDGRSIFLNNGLWGTVDDSLSRDPLVTYPCPHGYCRCFVRTIIGPMSCDYVMDSNNSNRQCSCDREGDLCGSCRSGMGVTALLNNCTTCSGAFGALIAALIIVDLLIFLAALTFALSCPLPSWVYPCLFYLQILPLMTDYFPTTFEKFRPYLYYVGSALGFYFPYDFCLYEDMTELVSYTLRYIPFFIALIVCPIVVVIRKFKFTPVPWHGMWFIHLFLYTPVVHTSMSILNCPTLPGQDGTRVPRWFINGNVKCFNGGHIPLGLLAIAILFTCTLVSPLAVLFSLDYIKKVRWLHNLVEPLTNPYKEIFKWWSAIDLFRRLLLLTFIVALPGNDYPAIYILLIIIVMIGFCQPYKHWYSNVLEVVFASDVLVLLLLRNTNEIENDLQVLPQQSGLRRMGRGNREECGDIEGVTQMAWLLFPFSYLPLAVSLIILIGWIVYKVGGYVRQKKFDCRKKQVVLDPQSSLVLPQKPRTTTTVAMEDLDSPTSPGVPVHKPTLSTVDVKELERKPGLFGKKELHESGRRLLSWSSTQEVDSKPVIPTHSLPRNMESVF